VDAFKPDFNVTELISMCENRNAKYMLLFEYGGSYPYFNSTLTMAEVYYMTIDSGRFNCVTFFGESPLRIYILTFV
jgi:hypothetical protein